MKTLNQELLFFIAGGSDNPEDCFPGIEGEVEVPEIEVPEIEEETDIPVVVNAFLSKMTFGCC